jgi:hypothetical protein
MAFIEISGSKTWVWTSADNQSFDTPLGGLKIEGQHEIAGGLAGTSGWANMSAVMFSADRQVAFDGVAGSAFIRDVN